MASRAAVATVATVVRRVVCDGGVWGGGAANSAPKRTVRLMSPWTNIEHHTTLSFHNYTTTTHNTYPICSSAMAKLPWGVHVLALFLFCFVGFVLR